MSSKTKKIIKSPKTTRTRSKKALQSKIEFYSLLKTPKSVKKESNSKKSRSCSQRRKNNLEASSESEKLIIDINLGQYGFDNQEPIKGFSVIEEILKSCNDFAQNPDQHKIKWRQICEQAFQRFKDKNSLLEGKNIFAIHSGRFDNMKQMSKKQYILWETLNSLLFKIKYASQSPGLLGTIKNCTMAIEDKMYQSKKLIQNKTSNDESSIFNLNEALMKQIAFKTFLQGLHHFQVDQLNYFLIKQYDENNRFGRMQKKLTNWAQWAAFIQKKRVRLRKANKFLLHTSCQLCLSPYSESFNPIENCPQCHIRGHRLCLGLGNSNRCGRCTYLRLSNEMKQKIPQCFICNSLNIAPLKISSSKFAHIFCLFFHNMWQIKNGHIEYRDSSRIQNNNRRNQKCKYCNRNTNFIVKCTKCESSCHSLCGFLNGDNIFMDEDGEMKLTCCWGCEQSRLQLSWKRKYTLNYQNIVFRKLGEVQRQIKGVHKKRRKEKNKGQKGYEFLKIAQDQVCLDDEYNEMDMKQAMKQREEVNCESGQQQKQQH